MIAMQRGVALYAASMMMGCTAWLEVDSPQCTSNKQCVELLGDDYSCARSTGVCTRKPAQGAAGTGSMIANLPPEWECLNEPKKTFVPDIDKTVRVRMDVVDFTSLRVPAGLKASACNPADVQCQSPVVSGVEPGPDGFLEFTVPHGFAGFLTFEAPAIVPALSFNNRPWIDNETTSGPALASLRTLMDISEHSGRPYNPDTGLAILEIRNCKDGPGDGTAFDPVDGEEPFYFDGALPARDLTATTISTVLGAMREPRAAGGFSNLEPGYKTFNVRIAGTEHSVARITMSIRAGHISYVRIYPGY